MDRLSMEKWEWPADEIRRVGHRVIDLIADHLTELRSEPVFRPFPPGLAAKYLNSTLPEHGLTADEILDRFACEIEPYPFGNGHPRFYGWVNSPPAMMGIFADALAAAMNPSCAGGNHAAVYVEREVVQWFKQILGFPEGAMGLLVSGSSMAALTALAVARHTRCGYEVRTKGVQSSPARLTFYRTSEGHGCHQKAVELLGIGSDHMRVVPTDRTKRMLPDALDTIIRGDRENGCTPIAVIASAGTVNTGAIDPLDRIADVCSKHNVWLHVDGAYGGPAILARQYSDELSALARADSIALDPHKWLCVPVEAGLVLVRDGANLRTTFSLVPPYLQTDGDTEGVGGLPWFSEYGFQQTRGFRALKVWMALQFHGISGYRALVEQNIALAQGLVNQLKCSDHFEIFEPQHLSIVCFRYVTQNLGHLQDLNELNKAIVEKVQLGGEVFLSNTLIDDTFWLRACIVNPRTREEDIVVLPRIVEHAASYIMSESLPRVNHLSSLES